MSDSSDSEDNFHQALGKKPATEQHVILPAKGGPQLDTSNWPLLLKVRIHLSNLGEAYINSIHFCSTF